MIAGGQVDPSAEEGARGPRHAGVVAECRAAAHCAPVRAWGRGATSIVGVLVSRLKAEQVLLASTRALGAALGCLVRPPLPID